jgi:hypothetical protein
MVRRFSSNRSGADEATKNVASVNPTKFVELNLADVFRRTGSRDEIGRAIRGSGSLRRSLPSQPLPERPRILH